MTETPGEKSTIVLENVGKTFHTPGSKAGAETFQALSGVDLAVRKDEFVSFIGPSGCGKTTLLRIIDGLIPPDEGRVLIDGQEVREPGTDRAMIFQHFGLLPWKTVLENVSFGLKLQKVPRNERLEKARHYVDLVGLSGFESYFPHQLSGGMQQRAGIARALCTDARILLMDEPLGAVDAQTRELMQEEILRLWQREKRTVIFITHSIDEAVYLSDRVIIMTTRPGRIDQAIQVDLPRPRWDYDVRSDKRFIEVRHFAWDRLKSYIAKNAGQVKP
jgi:NitT/TauT family transport system ATP-binding protein